MSRVSRISLYRVGALAPAVLRTLREDLRDQLPFDVRIAERVIDPKPAYVRNRQQYSALILMKDLLTPKPGEGERCIAIAAVDLFLPVFTHVIGSAQLGGAVGITSTFRIRPEYSGLPHNAARLRERLFKEVLHELGHTSGLVHCDLSWCVMAASTLAEHIDLKDDHYCPNCAQLMGLTTSMEKTSWTASNSSAVPESSSH